MSGMEKEEDNESGRTRGEWRGKGERERELKGDFTPQHLRPNLDTGVEDGKLVRRRGGRESVVCTPRKMEPLNNTYDIMV